MTKTFYYLTLLCLAVLLAGAGCGGKKKESDEPVQYIPPKPKGKTMDEVRAELKKHIVDAIDRWVDEDRSGRKYGAVAEYYQDFNNDGRTDYLLVFEYAEKGEYVNNIWHEDAAYGVGYVLSNKETKDYDARVVYDVLPSISEASKRYGDKEKYAYTLVGVESPKNNTLTLKYTDYYFDGDEYEEVKEAARKKKMESFWAEMTFECDTEQNFFRLVKFGGLNVYGKGEQYIDFNDSQYTPLYLIDWSWKWYAPLKFMTVNNTPEKEKTIYVTDEVEFVEAIGSDRTIIIQVDELNLTSDTIEAKMREKNDQYKISEFYDSLYGLKNLTIIGRSGAGEYEEEYSTRLVSDETSDIIFFVSYSSNITLRNLHMTHDVPPGGCEEGVFSAFKCQNLHIRNCTFDGSGIVGIALDSVTNAVIESSYFLNNSDNAIKVRDSENIHFFQCSVYQNKTAYPTVSVNNSSVRFGRCYLSSNVLPDEEDALISFTVRDHEKTMQKEENPINGRLEFFDMHIDENEGESGCYLMCVKEWEAYTSLDSTYMETQNWRIPFTPINPGEIAYESYDINIDDGR
ncbi:right-handed parallel beta-helix repeat-containing protein [Dysgonomonas sp. 25]|uniref:right-handed parallel beta-helix repeat-containing protein n=1 Tax=Dysgonomonas sp. 25 TaxID=2302933 RepID=UPI0013D46FC7|nr:right-handed parallel beta-helix repeat-containing protein [Dysgonomonas sp. 25]NDV69201.1 right-handed parallel beta-helix repeat-containing protein [Dysgonomonas sp. 25]